MLARDKISDLGQMTLTSIIPAFMPDMRLAREGSSDVSSTHVDEEHDDNDDVEAVEGRLLSWMLMALSASLFRRILRQRRCM